MLLEIDGDENRLPPNPTQPKQQKAACAWYAAATKDSSSICQKPQNLRRAIRQQPPSPWAPKLAAFALIKSASTKNDQCRDRATAKMPAPNPNFATVAAIFFEWADGGADKRFRENEASSR